MNQAAWKAKQKMGVKKTRDQIRKMGTICLRCLSRPVHRGKRCFECWQLRELENKGRKR